MIPRHTIDQIFGAANIEEVVGEFVKLKRAGKDFKGLCPFHNEKTPSFTVSPNLGIYKCFGCGKGGNVVDFVMEHEKLTYPEALRMLASRYHIEIEEDYSNKEELSEQVMLREGLYSVLEFARKFFIEKLNEGGDANIGKDYFRERGINDITSDDFDLGYAPDSWRTFTEYAFKNQYEADILLKAGLIKKKSEAPEESTDTADYYDAYRHRVIFPIHAPNGKVIGFGGRQLNKEEKSPKYINSPESEVYHKSSVLYGLYQARHDLRQRDDCFLVEGYMDVITLHQSGIKNVVATSGTALTKDQVRLIRRFTDNVTLLYDGDKAGLKAALRGLDLLLEQDLNTSVVVFPEGEDPDSYCRKLGGQGLDNFITENKKDVILFMSELLLEEHGNTPSGISATAHHIVETLNKIPDSIKRNEYIRLAARNLNIDEEVLFAEARKQAGRRTPTQRRQQSQKQLGMLLPRVQKDPKQIKEEGDKEWKLLDSLIRYCELPFDEDLDVPGYVFHEFQDDEYAFENAVVGRIILDAAELYNKTGRLEQAFFVQHELAAKRAADVLSRTYDLSPLWRDRYEISVKGEMDNYQEEIENNLMYLKFYKTNEILRRIEVELQTSQGGSEEQEVLMKQYNSWLNTRSQIADHLQIVTSGHKSLLN